MSKNLMKSPLDVLTDESKWMKYHFSNKGNTRFCIQGVLEHLEISHHNRYRWRKAILQSICEHFPERVEKWIKKKRGQSLIATFNDSSHTTFSQVHKVLRDAELKLEMEE